MKQSLKNSGHELSIFRTASWLYVALVIAIMFLVAGCQATGRLLLTGLVESSTYMPGLSQDYDGYLKKVTAVSGKVVTDDVGTFYHHVEGDLVRVAMLRRDEEGALRNMFGRAVALLEPIYVLDAGGRWQVDWAATEARRAMLIDKLKLNILPIAASRRYHELLHRHAVDRSSRPAGAAGVTHTIGDAFSSNTGLYSNQYWNGLLSKLGEQFDYVVTGALTTNYFAALLAPGGQDDGAYTQSWISALRNDGRYALRFIPVSYFQNLKGGGQFRFHSGCMAVDIADQQRQANYGIGDAMADRKPDAIARNRQLFAGEVALQTARRVANEQFCVTAFRAFQVGGALRSDRLE